MPPLPSLVNEDPKAGPIVKPMILGYAMNRSRLDKWAGDHQVDEELSGLAKRTIAWKAISRRLPSRCSSKSAFVCDEDGELSCCVVLVSNLKATEMAMAQDMELIRSVQKLLGVNEPPKWYHPENVG